MAREGSEWGVWGGSVGVHSTLDGNESESEHFMAPFHPFEASISDTDTRICGISHCFRMSQSQRLKSGIFHDFPWFTFLLFFHVLVKKPHGIISIIMCLAPVASILHLYTKK